jgi:alcohol dehydrogenase (NADP+)
MFDRDLLLQGGERSMYKAKAYAAPGATSPLGATTIDRRDPKDTDVQIEILFCGICHSDVHRRVTSGAG